MNASDPRAPAHPRSAAFARQRTTIVQRSRAMLDEHRFVRSTGGDRGRRAGLESQPPPGGSRGDLRPLAVSQGASTDRVYVPVVLSKKLST